MSAEFGGSRAAEDLLRHAEFVRRLARSLLRDAHLADDVAQDALVAGLTSPAPRGRSLRAWLVGVVRNRVRMELRGAERRRRREHASFARTNAPAATQPFDAVARLESGRIVVDAVLALPEPYRTAIVLRYFDELSPPEIARRTAVPLDTAKTRLRRALALLRARLGERSPDGWAGACAVLVPLAGARGVTDVGTWLAGGGLMAAPSKSLAVVAALVLGVLVGAVGRDLLPETGSGSATSRESASTAGPDEVAGPAAPGTRRPNGVRTPDAVRRGGSAAASDAAPDSANAASQPRGTSTIRGRVATADGTPVGGVVVSAAPATDMLYETPTPPPHLDLAVWAGSLVRAESRRRALGGSASTGDDGRYEIRGLGRDAFHVTASHADYELEVAQGFESRWVSPEGVVEFVAVPVVPVRVDVVGPPGDAIDEAVVVVHAWGAPIDERVGVPRGAQRLLWTPDLREIRLRAGTWGVGALARNGLLRAASERVEVVAKGAGAPVTLRLVPRTGIRGRLRDAPLNELGFGRVHLLRVADGEADEAASMRLLAEGKARTVVQSDDYRFRFDDLEPGRYVLGSSQIGRELFAWESVTVGAEHLEHDLVVPRRTEDRYIEVRVLGADGLPLEDADVVIAMPGWTPPRGLPSGDVESQGRGVFQVRREPSDRTSGALRLVVRSASCGERHLPFDPRARSPLEIRFEAPTSLELTIGGAEDPEVRGGVRASLRPAASAGAGAALVLDSERRPVVPGRALRFDALQPGEYSVELSVEAPGGRRSRRVAVERVTVRAGENRTALALPRLATLTVEVPGAAAGVAVQLSVRPDGPPVDPESWKTGADGRVAIELLPPGRYSLSCTLDGRLHVAVADVPADAVATLRPVEQPPEER